MKRRGFRPDSPASRPRKGRCYWFSGIPGTDVRKALNALTTAFPSPHGPPKPVYIEDELKLCYARTESGDDAAKTKEASERLDKPGGFKAILNYEAPPRVQELWGQAVRLAARKANKYLKAGSDVFLTFHAVFFADKFGDFYSPVDGELIDLLPPPAKFLTFIDDIGDVAMRLRGEGQVFSSNREKFGFKSVEEALRDLLTILEWRASELTVSRLIGSFVKCPPFVLAVKHPVETALRVLLDDGTPAYISHPITESRRAFDETGQWDPFMRELQTFTDALVTQPNKRKQSKQRVIPIVPTSIDELRIKSREIGRVEKLIPRLLDRWDLPNHVLLVPRPGDPKTQNWLDPQDYFKAQLEPDKGKLSRQTISEIQKLEGLLAALSSRILNQVNARDHTLVTQCPTLVAYRPYVGWRLSGGVEEEIKHQLLRLRSSGKRKRSVIILHRREDLILRKLGIIVEGSRLFNWVRDAALVDDSEVSRALKEGLDKNRPPSFSASNIQTTVKAILKKAGILPAGLRERDRKRVLGQTTATDIDAQTERLWKDVANSVAEDDPLKDLAAHWLVRDWTPEQFAMRLNEHISTCTGGSNAKDRRSAKLSNHWRMIRWTLPATRFLINSGSDTTVVLKRATIALFVRKQL